MNYFLIQHVSIPEGRFIDQLHYTILSSHVDNPDNTDHFYWEDMLDTDNGVLIDLDKLRMSISHENQLNNNSRIRILQDIEDYIISQREQSIDEII